MRVRRWSGSGGVGAGGRLAALALALLVLHAVFITAAHTHVPAPLRSSESRSSLGAGDGHAPEQARDHGTPCTLCRLQRTLSSSLDNSARLFVRPTLRTQPAPESAVADARGLSHHTHGGRAPPPA